MPDDDAALDLTLCILSKTSLESSSLAVATVALTLPSSEKSSDSCRSSGVPTIVNAAPWHPPDRTRFAASHHLNVRTRQISLRRRLSSVQEGFPRFVVPATIASQHPSGQRLALLRCQCESATEGSN